MLHKTYVMELHLQSMKHHLINQYLNISATKGRIVTHKKSSPGRSGFADKCIYMPPIYEQALFSELFEILECWIRNCRPMVAIMQPPKGGSN